MQHSSRMAAVDDSIGDNIWGCCFPATDRLSFIQPSPPPPPFSRSRKNNDPSLSFPFFVVLNTNHLSWASAGGKKKGALIIADDAKESSSDGREYIESLL